MGLFSTVLCFFGFGVGVTMGLVIGYFLFVYFQPTDVKDPVIRPIVELDTKSLESMLPEIPHWVKNPDFDRIDWLTKFVAHMWPYLEKAICKNAKEIAKPIIAENSAKYKIDSVEFETLTLGSLPPVFQGMKVYTTDEQELIMEPIIKWAGNPNITIVVKAFGIKASVQVIDLQVSALPRITLKPLVPSFPCFAKILVSLMEKPHVDFGLKLLGADVMAIPGLYAFVQGHVPIGSKSSSPRLRSPMQVASSPGVNMLAKSEASRRALSMVRSAALKREKMEGCPESSKQSPSCDMTSPIPDPPHISPSLEDLSPDTRITHSQALKIKRRKLISAIWTEDIPIYRDGKLVEGRCMYCRQVFAAARDKGTSHLKRHLKVCEAKIAEWKIAEAICKLLEIYYTATVTLSGSKYPTSHLHFYQFWKIKKMLNKEESNMNRKLLNEQPSTQDLTISHMIQQMQLKFNQYWIEKYDFLEFLLHEFGSEEEVRKCMSEVKQIMKDLFDEYSKEVPIQSQRESDTEVGDDDDPLAKWDHYMKSKRGQSSNELDRYLKEDLTPRKEEVDILEWWKKSSSKYPVLSKMARDILAIPASTVPLESAFSTGGHVISDYRSSLACSTVESLICL